MGTRRQSLSVREEYAVAYDRDERKSPVGRSGAERAHRREPVQITRLGKPALRLASNFEGFGGSKLLHLHCAAPQTVRTPNPDADQEQPWPNSASAAGRGARPSLLCGLPLRSD